MIEAKNKKQVPAIKVVDKDGEVYFNSIANIRSSNTNEKVSLDQPAEIKEKLYKRLKEWWLG